MGAKGGVGKRHARELVREVEAVVGWHPTRFQMSELVKDVSARDELGLVLRGHLYVEHTLNEMLGVMMPYAGRLRRLNLTFTRKVELARALGVLILDEEKPLLALNELRNRYAHDLKGPIGEAQVERLYGSITTEWLSSLSKGGRTSDLRESVVNFVLLLVVALDAKLVRLEKLRGDVVALHRKCLAAYAAGIDGHDA